MRGRGASGMVARSLFVVLTHHLASAAGMNVPCSLFVLAQVIPLEGAATRLSDPYRFVLILGNPIAPKHRSPALADLHTGERIGEDVVVLQRPLAVVSDENAALLAVVDPVAPQERVGSSLDLHAHAGIGEDVVVLQRPLAVVIKKNATLLSIVDAVAPQAGVSAAVDADSRVALAADVAVLQVEATLCDIDRIKVAAAGLAEGEVDHAAEAGFEEQAILPTCLDDDLLDRAVAHNFERLVQHERLSIKAGMDEDALGGRGILDCFRNARVVAAAGKEINDARLHPGGRAFGD